MALWSHVPVVVVIIMQDLLGGGVGVSQPGGSGTTLSRDGDHMMVGVHGIHAESAKT